MPGELIFWHSCQKLTTVAVIAQFIHAVQVLEMDPFPVGVKSEH